MCGIAGYISDKKIDQKRILNTLSLMRNRGPDHRGYKIFVQETMQIAFLHSRLAIVDLEERANQPLMIGDHTIIFNGEIYNYKELRHDLEKRGIVFKTKSDTEVLLRSYMEFGEACVDQLEGMWSFAIYDAKAQKLFLSRDRFGEKPLYFFRGEEGIFFGSEVKFLKSLTDVSFSVNHRQMLRYLVNGYRSLYKTEETFFEGIHEVPYATNVTIDGNLQMTSKRYWQPVFSPRKMSLQEAIEGFRHHLLESIRIRLRADVPLAFCLSGGIDSSSIVSIAAKCFHYNVATFSIIDQDERYNEAANIQATIEDLNCKHTLIETTPQNSFDRLEKLIRYHDAPVSTISYYVHSLLSEAISQQGYKVTCSGTACDELITGYFDHFNLHLYEMRNSPRFPQHLEAWKKKIAPLIRNPYLQNYQLYFDDPQMRDHIYLNNDIFASYLKTDFHEPFKENNFCGSLLRNRMLNEMFHEVIPVILHEDDLNSMHYSVENRSPYLDSKLFDFAYSIPSEHLIQEGFGKYILREAVKGILNEKVRLDPQKKGFNTSVYSAFNFSEKKNRDFLLENSDIYDWVNREKIEELLSQEPPWPNSHSKFLFSFISTKIFLELNKTSNLCQSPI